ncbi:hypothetical protein H072_9827 [Dactylellina haptotyla CBS 200.50]|uniref:Cytochrome P450 n=1 Tax=Dactylellina haptotyla (strain CBS 200.50) TaxID=1284197 RepID=S8A1I8_DACHA|nr:hypothetical protein H072_9827 [Dactylellina haptotyla CBS 200.50]
MLSVIDVSHYGAVGFGAFWVLRALYRLSPFHPLAKIPGPRLAATTQWYEFYYNVYQDGQFIFKTVEWHEKYGPVVRIGPDEVHISDPSFYNVLYGNNYRFVKAQPHYRFAQQTEGGLGNCNTRTHKIRRTVLDPLFSTQAVMKLEPRIRTYVDQATARIARAVEKSEQEGFEINMVFRCLTVDVISEYAYSESMGMLQDERLNDPFFVGMDNLIRMTWMYSWTWRMQDLMRALPYELVKKIMPEDVLGVVAFQKQAEDRVITFLADPEKAKAKSTHTTVFEVLLSGNEEKGYEVPSLNALKEEAWGFLAAGSETTAAALSNGLYEACKVPKIQDKVYGELLAEFPDIDTDTISYKRLLQLPYLTAFIKETLRLPPGVPGRLPRLVPKDGITVCGQFIPEGTTIGMSSILQQNDPTVFKDPSKFDPDRWIRDKIPEQYFVPFGKGSRGCQGMNLAWAEIYLMYANLLRRYRFEFHESSTLTDAWTDQFIPKREGKLRVVIFPRENSLSLRPLKLESVATMNSLFNSALKQSQSLKRDIDNFQGSPVTSSPALQGQISASLASFNRTIDDYDAMAKRELIPAKQEKAKERVKNFRTQYSEFKDQFDKLKNQREEADTLSNRNELSGRRGHSSATPDNPYSYSTPPAAANRPAGSTAFGAPLTSSNLTRESHALHEQTFLSRTNDALDEFLARGRAVQEELAMNKLTLKDTQRRLYTVANTLGISGDTIRMIERRAKEDNALELSAICLSMSTTEASEPPVLRQAGMIERFHIIRSSINFYNNVVVSASYSTAVPITPDDFIRALHSVLKEHPVLSVGIQLSKDKATPPSFIRLPQIDFTKSQGFLSWETSDTAPTHDRERKQLITRLHNLPFSNDLLTKEPLWRVAVLKRSYNTPTAHNSDTNGEGRVDYEIAFCVHHAICDGLSGAAFHYSLVKALNGLDVQESGGKWDVYTPPEDLELLPPMEECVDMGLGFKTAGRVAGHLAKGVLPSFLHKSVWTGGKVGEKLENTKLDVAAVEAYTMEHLVKTLKEKKISMTAFLTYATADAFYSVMKSMDEKEAAKMKAMKVSLPMSYRKHAEWGNDVMVDCIGAINWDIEKFKSLDGEVHAMKKLTHELRHASGATRDSEVGLLALVGDMEGFFRGQLGKERGLTFEVSNLGFLDESKIGGPRNADSKTTDTDAAEKKKSDWRIEEAWFSQSSSIAGPAFSVNVVTVRGKMVLVVQWMENILRDDIMEAVTRTLDTNISTFGTEPKPKK